MNNGEAKMYSKYQPFMTYIEPKEIVALKKFSKKNAIPMAQIVREAISSKLSGGDPYVSGFNSGIDSAITEIKAIQAAQMRFPSGRTFGEVISDEVIKLKMKEEHEAGA